MELKAKWLGIDTYKEHVVYIRKDCYVCQAEGFEVQTRVRVTHKDRDIVATIQFVTSDILIEDEISLSIRAWKDLGIDEGDAIHIKHAKPALSMSYVRSKMYGHEFTYGQLKAIIEDISQGRYSDIMISAFLTSCVGSNLNIQEIIDLTKNMVEVGQKLDWQAPMIVDKHCVGGLPGNRTTPIVVAIVTSYGLTMPKTSSRAITSPAGTADTMEVLTSVALDIDTLRDVVKKEGGCFAWGGSVSLSPADDILIRVERVLDVDSEGQLIASVLSKKIAAGSTHVLIDIPVGRTAKVRNLQKAESLRRSFSTVGDALGIHVRTIISEAEQPVGRGVGPALEAKDILSVLKNDNDAPIDLKERSLMVAGAILEFSPDVNAGEGIKIARDILETGKAWEKFQSICTAQGGLRTIPVASHAHVECATRPGLVHCFNNRRIAMVAKLAGAPIDKSAGIELHVKLDSSVEAGQPLYTIHCESEGQLHYALDYIHGNGTLIEIVDR